MRGPKIQLSIYNSLLLPSSQIIRHFDSFTQIKKYNNIVRRRENMSHFTKNIFY